jgi:hypothetical protein
MMSVTWGSASSGSGVDLLGDLDGVTRLDRR